MAPVTLLATQKLAALLTTDDALQQQVESLATANGSNVPSIVSAQIVLSSAPAGVADLNVQLTYPRVCLYASGIKNQQTEKFRSLSGTVSVVAEVWASGDVVQSVDEWIHFYVEGLTEILRQNIGDWGDGMFFSGIYDVQFQPPKAGGLGYVEAAKISCDLNISLS